MSGLTSKLALATLTLVSANVQAEDSDWEVDTTYLSYVEADNRVSVAKSMANLTREQEGKKLSVNLVHDTMSGSSPTGAVRSSDSAVTFTGVSGGTGFSAGNGSDYSLSTFEDTRIQAGFNLSSPSSRAVTIDYGAVVSQESDFDSVGGNVGFTRESTDKLASFTMGLAATFDSIYQSDSGATPQPLGDVTQNQAFGKGQRNTLDALVGGTRVLNKQTVAQVNVSLSLSNGYHSDPYKIISATTENNQIIANYHDSRPESRVRTSLFGNVVHQLGDTPHSIHIGYRAYYDDWGINSHTADFRYHRQLTRRQYLEPHVRVYRQSQADFYYRRFYVDDALNPILPSDGLASSDYRLDAMTSVTLGMKYGLALTKNTDLRVRAEYLAQTFDNDDYSKNNAIVFQTSLKYKF
ncbi:MAG: DUF3570 domain-containing protein [Granulosicoccaceae bacterium]